MQQRVVKHLRDSSLLRCPAGVFFVVGNAFLCEIKYISHPDLRQ